MSSTVPRAQNVEDLDALLDRLRQARISLREIARRRRVATTVDRLREQSLPIPIQLEELIRRERGEYGD